LKCNYFNKAEVIIMINDMLEKLADVTASSRKITEDIILLEFTVVNSSIINSRQSNGSNYIIVDTGLKSSANDIIKTAEESFGKGSKPKAIILTHGHFDHIGSVKELIEYWNVPVYAHKLEMPYLTGEKDYPVGDSTVDGGMIAEMSPAFPHTSINLGTYIHELSEDGSIPFMPDWRYIHTPGHTPGHISLFHDSDRVLIVGDAFTTVKQESLTSVITQKKDISGPPAYLTTDWDLAEQSVRKLSELKPSMAIPSHGKPIKGEELSSYLNNLVKNFHCIAVPEHGRFVNNR
jgi:glyoxylase-like metal-dependent hydrolase (beta-lactamase superfamily II)